MIHCFFTNTEDKNLIPIEPIISNQFFAWINQKTESLKNWLNANNFTAKANSFCILPKDNGEIAKILVGIDNIDDYNVFGLLADKLPNGHYQIINQNLALKQAALFWGLGSYKFSVYKKLEPTKAKLFIPPELLPELENLVKAIFLVRDLINYPAQDLTPAELANRAKNIFNKHKAKITEIIGDDLAAKGLNGIYTVGNSSPNSPRLLDIRWGKKDHPKVTLVGKGICFDSGGLELKSLANMLFMKKDMAGAAHAIALAELIMAENLPINLRVLLPLAENTIGSKSFKPGDIIKSYKGITVEINETDAEGRLILMDALTLACEDKPELLIDFATLTGAARIAVGTEISGMFCNNDHLAQQILMHSELENDPIWRLPLFQPYREMLKSSIADIVNSTSTSYAKAITAALFLQEFVTKDIPWIHFDFMAYNLTDKPSHPKGGEAQAMRAMFSYLKKQYGSSR